MRVYKVKNDKGQVFEVDEDKLSLAEADGYLPIVSDGVNEYRVSSKDLHLQKKDGFKPLGWNQEPGILETQGRKLTEGFTFGYMDEIAGAGEALGRVVGLKNTSKDITDIELTKPTLNLEELKKAYQEGRDYNRRRDQEAQEANPGTAITANLQGAIISPVNKLMPGQAQTRAQRVAGAAGLGGLAGTGYSESEDTLGVAKDQATGAALGGGLQYAGEKILSPLAKKGAEKASRMMNKAKETVDDTVLPKSGKILAGVDENVTKRYLERQSQVNQADSLDEIGTWAVDDVLTQFREKLSAADAKAWDELSSVPSIRKQQILVTLDEMAEEILKGKSGDLTRTAQVGADAEKLGAIRQVIEGIENSYDDLLSERDLKSLVKDLQDKAYSFEGSPKTTHRGQVLRNASGALNEILKSGNEAYQNQMNQVQNLTKNLKNFERAFVNRLNPESGEKFVQTAQRLLKKPDSSPALKALKTVDKVTGQGLEDLVRDSLAKSVFLKQDQAGSRKTLMGALLGNAMGAVGAATGQTVAGPVGQAVGGAVGYSLDKVQGQVFKGVLDGRLQVPQAVNALTPKLGRFAQPLVDQAARGPKAVAQAHFILAQKYPDYLEMLKKQEEGEADE